MLECLHLFQTFLLLGAFSFGGGLASLELIRSRVVEQRLWMSDSEFTDIISISEMTPGPIGINVASFTGTRVAGIPGTICATVAYVLPAIAIVSLVAWLYLKYRNVDSIKGVLRGIRPVIAAMALASAIKLAKNAWFSDVEFVNVYAVILTLGAFALLEKKKIGAIQAILFSGLIGAILYYLVGMI